MDCAVFFSRKEYTLKGSKKIVEKCHIRSMDNLLHVLLDIKLQFIHLYKI